MRGWLQRIRGALGMGVTWAVGWAPIGAVVGTVLHYLLPGAGLGLSGVIALNATTFAVLGFFGGTIFATVLRITEGRHRFDELSGPRFAGWGALGGLLLGGIAATTGLWGGGLGVLGVGMMGAATLLGAGSAAATLAVARAGGESERIEAGAGDAGLGEAEQDYLLGEGT